MSLKNCKIQSIKFAKDKYTQEQAIQWCQDNHYLHNFQNKRPLEDDQHIVMRQKHKSKHQDTKVGSLEYKDGIFMEFQYHDKNFVPKGFCKTKKSDQESDPQQQDTKKAQCKLECVDCKSSNIMKTKTQLMKPDQSQ